jgi:diguanylate cyclase (GGDEF)-like protein
MSRHSFWLAPAYAVPTAVLTTAVMEWPAGTVPAAVGLVLVGTCQGLLYRAHLTARQSARLDPLTGLPGRAILVDRLRRALRGPTEVGLVFVDLDRFKNVNDTHGHGAGDRVLIETACRLRRVVPAGSVVARYGGDEFAVLIQAGPASVGALAGRIDSALRQHVAVVDGSGPVLAVSASVGAATSVGGAVDDLLAAADRAMYEAKAGPPGIWTTRPESRDVGPAALTASRG